MPFSRLGVHRHTYRVKPVLYILVRYKVYFRAKLRSRTGMQVLHAIIIFTLDLLV